jgi:hypothetical protein
MRRRLVRNRIRNLPSATYKVLCSEFAWFVTLMRTNEIDLTEPRPVRVSA